MVTKNNKNEGSLIFTIEKQIDTENNLFHLRTTAFLITNGLFFTALGNLNQIPYLNIIISILGFIISIIWYLCMKQSIEVMKALYLKYEEMNEDGLNIIKLIEDKLCKYDKPKPDELLGRALPIIFIISWILLITYSIYVLFKIGDLL